jgi:hypothetical protein
MMWTFSPVGKITVLRSLFRTAEILRLKPANNARQPKKY